eukprot:9483840-Pyramimonas_sp.AAC.2
MGRRRLIRARRVHGADWDHGAAMRIRVIYVAEQSWKRDGPVPFPGAAGGLCDSQARAYDPYGSYESKASKAHGADMYPITDQVHTDHAAYGAHEAQDAHMAHRVQKSKGP